MTMRPDDLLAVDDALAERARLQVEAVCLRDLLANLRRHADADGATPDARERIRAVRSEAERLARALEAAGRAP